MYRRFKYFISGVYTFLFYLTIEKLLSYAARYFLLHSERGGGKSYYIKWFLLKRYFNKGRNLSVKHERFVCLFRTVGDLENAKLTWIEPFVHPSETDTKHKPIDSKMFKWKGNKNGSELYYGSDSVPIAWFLALENVNKIKQRVFSSDIRWVWFDEYIPMAYVKLRGIPNETEALRTIVKTIDHDYHNNTIYPPKVRVILTGNLCNYQSPILDDFKVNPYKYGVYRINRDVVVETVPPNAEVVQGGLADIHRYELATIPDAYVKNRPAGSVPQMSIKLGNRYDYRIYSFYVSDKDPDIYYIVRTNKHKGTLKLTQFFDRDYEERGLLWYYGVSSDSGWRKYLRQRADMCCDYYDSVYTKQSYLRDIVGY